MVSSLITYLQIFGIGFSFGIIGPCFLVCTPLVITYIVGSNKRLIDIVTDTLTFLTGRLVAYITLGLVAGLSGRLLRQFISSDITSNFKTVAGALSILFGILILRYRNLAPCEHPRINEKICNSGGLFVFGLIIGITPCAPLTALLFEIALMSKNALEGMTYAFFFGLGTFLSGLVIVASLAGLFTKITSKMLKSKGAVRFFRIGCSALLILFGLLLIFGFAAK